MHILLPSLSSHKAIILYELLSRRTIKNKGMFNHLDSNYCASRISELRSDGWPIDDQFLHESSKLNKRTRVKEYFITTININKLLQNKDILNFVMMFESIKKAG